MEKQDAAMDSRLPAFICATMSSRSVLLMLLINSIYLNKNPQAVSRQATKPLHTQRGDSIYRLPIGSLGHLSKCEHDCLSCAHCMGTKLRNLIRKIGYSIIK